MLRMQNEYGLEVNKHRQGFGLHPGFDRVKALFIEGDLTTDQNPVSRWMYDNAEAKKGSDQRIMIDKSADEKKVDGVISDAMAEMEVLSKDLESLTGSDIEVW
jgi:phage terminase large subunit-like protein